MRIDREHAKLSTLLRVAIVLVLFTGSISYAKQTPAPSPRKQFEKVCTRALKKSLPKRSEDAFTVCGCIADILDTKINPLHYADVISLNYQNGKKKTNISDEELDTLLDFEMEAAQDCLDRKLDSK